MVSVVGQPLHPIKSAVQWNAALPSFQVSTALSIEFSCLDVLVDEFQFPFQSKQHAVHEYKRELIRHVENGLGSKLRAKLSTELVTYTEDSRREMTGNKWYAVNVKYFILLVG